MRQVIESVEERRTNTIDGVKFFLDPDRWVLIRSDPDRALLHVYVEATTAAETEQLSVEQIAWIEALVRGN